MLTSQIADRLVELCRKGEFEAAQNELFSEDAISIEPEGAPMELTEGLYAIQEKGRHFAASIEQMHGIEVSEPVVAGKHFSLSMSLDVTMKDRGRVVMEEICLYEVEEGKIISEQFFYSLD